jgi:hypothetical protein
MFTIDYRVTLHLLHECEYDGSIILAQPFELSPVDGESRLVDPARHAELGLVLACFNKVVDSVAVGRKDGSLLLSFTDGTTIAASSHDQYEAWEINAPGVKMIAMPGGGEPGLFLAEDPPTEVTWPGGMEAPE